MTEEQIQKAARDIKNWLQDAVSDVASAMLEDPDAEPVWGAKIRKAKKRRVQDLHGWLADEIYSDADSIQDLVGDKVYDACARTPDRVALLEELQKTGHAALKTACVNILNDHYEANSNDPA